MVHYVLLSTALIQGVLKITFLNKSHGGHIIEQSHRTCV